MKRIKKFTLSVLSILLICTVILDDGMILRAFASNMDGSEISSEAGQNSGTSGGGEDTGNLDEGEGSGEDTGNLDEGEGSGEDTGNSDKGEGSGEDTGNSDKGEGSGENTGTSGNEGENQDNTEENGDKDNQGEIDENEPGSGGLEEKDPLEEDDSLAEEHMHIWVRGEDGIFPVCTECGEVYFDEDCDPEEGIGVHIFELIQEEGEEDKFRCVVCGYEKAFLEEWDLTLEIYMQIYGIETYTVIYNGETSSLPSSLAELRDAEKGGYYTDKVFNVRNLADLMALQSLSKEFSFEGYTITFVGREDTDGVGTLTRWDLTPLKNDYKGIGTSEFPFKGTLNTYYAGNSLRFITNTPLINYVAVGATISDFQITADINSESGDPVGIIAAHVVEDEGYDTVNLNEITLSGTVRNSQGAAGVLFGEVTASGDQSVKLCYQPDANITLSAEVNAKNAGGIAGRTAGNVEIHTFNPITTGNISGTESAGMLTGTMDGGTLYLEGMDEDNTITAKVSGSGESGGLIGLINGGKIEGTDDNKSLKIGGSINGTIAAGGVTGRCEKTEINIKNLQISATIEGTDVGRSSVGGVIGKLVSRLSVDAGNCEGEFDLIDQVQVTGNLNIGRAIGGIIGEVSGSNVRIGDPQSGSISVTGNINESNPPAGTANGGIVGIVCGQYIEVYHASVQNEIIQKAPSIGGVFGNVGDGSGRTIVKVKDTAVTSRFYQPDSTTARGGIFGIVKANSMAALDGTLSVNMSYGFNLHQTEHVRTGYIAGEQTEALIYFEKDAKYSREEKGWKDDIGNYGGIYLNGEWGEGTPLISYAEKKVTGSVGQNGGAWQLDTEADIIRLAIALNTNGRFAGNCFSDQEKGDLLCAEYQLTGKTYELTDSGIYSLNRNDDTGSREIFSGKLYGNGAVLRLGNYDTYQKYVALFPCVGNGAEFENFTLEGSGGSARKIQYAKAGAAGLSVYGQNNVTVKGVIIKTDLTGNPLNAGYLYGGMFAKYSAVESTTLTVEDCRLNGNILINQNGVGDDLNSRQYAGGMIAQYDSSAVAAIKIKGLKLEQQITSSSRYASGMITRINSQNTNTDRTVLDLSDIQVMDGSSLTVNEGNMIGSDDMNGGFLGREWFDVAPCDDSYSVRNLTIGSKSGAAPALNVKGTFGGMVHTVTGRMQIVNTQINGMRVNGNNTSNDGLLINNGYNALIEIDGYKVENLSIGGVNNFSEIVGRNVGTDPSDNGYTDYVNGGIVNIISKDFENSSKVYTNQAVPPATVSGKVRYYYNLFGNTLKGESTFLSGSELDGANIIIESADQMLIWHLNQYMNNSIRKRYLTPYFIDGNVPEPNGNVTIDGTINLANESYYPTPIGGGIVISGGNAQVEFHAKEIEDGADAGRKPSAAGEHYMMHSGLFLSKDGAVTVQGSGTGAPKDQDYFTLSGTVSNAGGDSGALFSKEISGVKNIYKIKLKNLYICNYDVSSHEHGLMIGRVNDNTTMDISWIQTEYTPTGEKAASALIGIVGRADTPTVKGTENISIDFTNMKVDDKTSGIFQNATFIDQFYYTDDTAVNKGRVRYLFTKEAAEGTNGSGYTPFVDDVHGHNTYIGTGKYVTIGNELKYGIEYWNQPGDIHRDLAADGEWSSYLPYVCAHPNTKEPEVNPKTEDIMEGCGIYEDPYVIESAKQILALSRYLTNADDKKYLTGWKINKIGSNAVWCNGGHTNADQVSYGDADFPTQDELRQAYYIITEDIDLSSLTYETDRTIAQQFNGLGTERKPFAGVIVGKKDDGTFPVITLPKKKQSNYTTNFGFIQYAKGAVVKDLVITSNTQEDLWDATLTDCIRVKENAGTVFACVLGGDNIIDQVTVSNRISPVSEEAVAGGYVGTVRQGSVILRNMSEDRLRNFQCLTDEGLVPVNPDNYPYVSGIVGKVENGFVMYEGANEGSAILPHEAVMIQNIYSHATLPVSRTYDIIVSEEDGMDAAKNDPMNIQKDAGGNFSCEVKTSAQLQIVSMAINSDAFSVYYDGGGYDRNAVCRKAKYDKVGACTEEDADYLAATGKDDGIYWYPYIYDYFTFNGVKAGESVKDSSGFYITLETYASVEDVGTTGYRSQLNAVTGDISASMSYSLVDTSTEIDYDLSVYKRGFRGLGATYRVFKEDRIRDYKDEDLTVRTNEVYSDFRANFNGSGATVKAVMINDYDQMIHTIALFNDLVNVDAQNKYRIQNLVVTGEFKNSFEENAGDVNYRNDRAAAVVGMMRRSWILQDITVKDAVIESNGHAGGIAAWINPGDEKNADEKSYSISDCQVSGTTSIVTIGGSSGGIVGVMMPTKLGTVKDLSLTLTNCKVSGAADNYIQIINNGEGLLSAADNNDQYRYGRGRTGGLIGFIGKRSDRDINGNVNAAYDDRVKVMIDVAVKENTVEYTNINGIDSTGGILGEYFGYSVEDAMVLNGANRGKITLNLENIMVVESVIMSRNRNENGQYSFGVGGIIGKIGRASGCKISDSKVQNADIRALYFNASDSANITMITASAGGIVGAVYYGSRITLSNITVEGKKDAQDKPENEILSATYDAGGMIGRNINIYTNNPEDGNADPNNTSIDITNCKVVSMNILSDNRTQQAKETDSSSGTSSGMAGGMVGRIDCAAVSIVKKEGEDNNKIEKCIIRTGIGGSVGGVLGQAYSRSQYTLAGIEVKDNIIGYNGTLTRIEVDGNNARGAGGVIGSSSGHVNNANAGVFTTGTLRELKISSCDIFGCNTGGIIGYVYRSAQIGNIWEKPEDEILITDSNLFGRYTGGAVGYSSNSVNKTCFEHVKIQKNKILSLWSNECYAGGFCGYEALNGVNNDYNQIDIEENWIMSCNYRGNNFNESQSSGGMFGHINSNDIAYELYTYETSLKDNHIGYYQFSGDVDSIIQASSNQVKEVTEEVRDLGIMPDKWPRIFDQSNGCLNAMPAGLKENTVINYARRFGDFVGTYGGNMHAYFIKPTVTYSDDYEGVRPVVDVGCSNIGTQGDTLLVSPYDYRKNIHIIYHEPEDGNSAAAKWGSTNVAGSVEDNLFTQIDMEKIIKAYKDAKGTGGTVEQLLNSYRLNIKNDIGKTIEEIYEQVYFGFDEISSSDTYRSPIKVNGTELPMIVLDARNGSADQLMHSVLAILTGSGGVLNSGENNRNPVYDHGLYKITKVECKPMQVENGTLKPGSGDPSLLVFSTGSSAGNDGYKELRYNKQKFDTYDTTGGTFTMVTITYGKETYTPISGVAKCTPQVTVNIPVFVTEMLTIDTYIKLVEGAEYNVEDAKEKGIVKEPMLATDSSYTMYVEYIYGAARNSFSTEEKPLSIEKTIGRTKIIDGKTTNVPYAAGTVFTLIDVCDSNKVYYYEVTGEETEAIPYSAFKNADEQFYDNKPIHGDKGLEVHDGEDDLFITDGTTYQDVGVERFLIIVDAPKDQLEAGKGDISDYHVTPVLTDDISKRTFLSEHNTWEDKETGETGTGLRVTIQPGLEIKFLTDNNETSIEGSLDRETHLVADGQFQIEADEAYWLRVLNSPDSVIDSANHKKFLELGMYLTTNNETKERIPLPDNTNVSIYIERLIPLPGEIQPEKNIGNYVNAAELYLYKDGKLEFPLDKLKDLIKKEMEDSGGRTQNKVTIHFKIDLGFEIADLSGYVDEEYGVNLELLRIEDPSYPGGGDIIGVYKDSCYGTRQSDLACAVETMDLTQLGINTYDNQAKKEETIDFRFKLDFTGVWDPYNTPANKDRADKWYTVTYRILEKTNRDGEPEYKPYTGSHLEIVLVNHPNNAGESSAGGGSQPELKVGTSSQGNEINSRYVTYKFDYDEIKDGSKDALGGQVERIIIRDLQLIVKDAADMDLTNYKIQASVNISNDPGNDIDTRTNPALNDFFVFTVAKLKTDLDY